MCTTMMVCVRAARALLGSQDISVLRGYSTGYEWTRLESTRVDSSRLDSSRRVESTVEWNYDSCAPTSNDLAKARAHS